MAGPDVEILRQLGPDSSQIKLEITTGLPTWEALPSPRHQITVDRIRASIKPLHAEGDCGCFHVSDVLIKFPDGSYKRPDIALFCAAPPESDDALEIVPLAVVEVVSRGYEAKDFELNPPFYLSQGVLDVVVHDPYQKLTVHYRGDGAVEYTSPAPIILEMGCTLTL